MNKRKKTAAQKAAPRAKDNKSVLKSRSKSVPRPKRVALPNIDLSAFATDRIPHPTCGAISRGTGINKSGLGRVFRNRACLMETGAKIAGYLGMTLDRFYSLLTREVEPQVQQKL